MRADPQHEKYAAELPVTGMARTRCATALYSGACNAT